jgi:hypothetical protein
VDDDDDRRGECWRRRRRRRSQFAKRHAVPENNALAVSMHIWREKRSPDELVGSGRRCANGESEEKNFLRIYFFLKKSLSILLIFPSVWFCEWLVFQQLGE